MKLFSFAGDTINGPNSDSQRYLLTSLTKEELLNLLEGEVSDDDAGNLTDEDMGEIMVPEELVSPLAEEEI